MRELRLITFCCQECGSIIKAIMNTNGSITFSVINKLHNSRNTLTEGGYYRCVECNNETNVRFEYIYK